MTPTPSAMMLFSAPPSSTPTRSSLLYTRNVGAERSVRARTAASGSAQATTEPVGSPRAISAARLGPLSAASVTAGQLLRQHLRHAQMRADLQPFAGADHHRAWRQQWRDQPRLLAHALRGRHHQHDLAPATAAPRSAVIRRAVGQRKCREGRRGFRAHARSPPRAPGGAPRASRTPCRHILRRGGDQPRERRAPCARTDHRDVRHSAALLSHAPLPAATSPPQRRRG